jgi:hypothetical protein
MAPRCGHASYDRSVIEPADLAMIQRQTRRPMRGLVAVAARCPVGHPCVVTCYPLRREGDAFFPFPTLYWLTCPRLKKAVAHLERDGTIAWLEAHLQSDAALRNQFEQDHARYRARRWALLTQTDRDWLDTHGLSASFHHRGIGGIAHHGTIKCLHLHVAHHLADQNVIGALVMNHFGIPRCEEA